MWSPEVKGNNFFSLRRINKGWSFFFFLTLQFQYLGYLWYSTENDAISRLVEIFRKGMCKEGGNVYWYLRWFNDSAATGRYSTIQRLQGKNDRVIPRPVYTYIYIFIYWLEQVAGSNDARYNQYNALWMLLDPWLPTCLPIWNNEFLWPGPFLQFFCAGEAPSDNGPNLSHECFLFGSAEI